MTIKGRDVPVLYGQDSDIIGFVVRCESSDAEFESDIADFAEQYKSGERDAYDDDGEEIDPKTITDEQARELAIDDLNGDWGRDGWRVTWVNYEDGQLTFQGDREGWTIFPTLLAAQDFIDKHLSDTDETLEIWGVID